MRHPAMELRLFGIEETARRIASKVIPGGVVLYPSDTVYGLMCRADDQEAVDRIREMKGCPPDRPFILIVSDFSMARSTADCTDPEVIEIMRLRWPGKLTLVLPALDPCPPWVRNADGSVALRQPDHDLSRLVIEECRVPLVSTSANPYGQPPCLEYDRMDDHLKTSVDLAVDAGTLPPSAPSTIIKLIRAQT